MGDLRVLGPDAWCSQKYWRWKVCAGTLLRQAGGKQRVPGTLSLEISPGRGRLPGHPLWAFLGDFEKKQRGWEPRVWTGHQETEVHIGVAYLLDIPRAGLLGLPSEFQHLCLIATFFLFRSCHLRVSTLQLKAPPRLQCLQQGDPELQTRALNAAP